MTVDSARGTEVVAGLLQDFFIIGQVVAAELGQRSAFAYALDARHFVGREREKPYLPQAIDTA